VSIVIDHLREIAPLFQVYVRPPGLTHTAPQEYVLEHGHEFTSARLTRDERRIVGRVLDCIDDPRAKQCYRNAQALVLADETRTLRYCEGYAISDVRIVAAHAWASIRGKVIDVTWPYRGRWVLGRLPSAWEYVGVEIDREYVVERRDGMGEPGSLLVDDTFEFADFLGWRAAQERDAEKGNSRRPRRG
jgi:hypothetical protein